MNAAAAPGSSAARCARGGPEYSIKSTMEAPAQAEDLHGRVPFPQLQRCVRACAHAPKLFKSITPPTFYPATPALQ